MAKILYVFQASVWAAAAELAAAELAFDGECKIVNLVNGENFSPEFMKKNPNGTLPTLEIDDKVYCTTADVVAALNADGKVTKGSAIVAKIHEDAYDPNFALLLCRNDEELAVKAAGLPALFLGNRQIAIEKYLADPEAAPFKDFLEAKKVQNGGMLAVVKGTAPTEAKAGFFAQSQAHFDRVKSAVLELLPGFLPDSGFIGGAVPGEDDFHVGAWLTRIAATVGAKSAEDALTAFEKEYGTPVPGKVAEYWRAWTARPSWQKVYADGLH
ncbi:GST N-terminal domain-containing protein [Mycena kentingensis (nom. inval.)]|nr:GST N-terminal domain-containing protein [Mycena kentingensis (nom. inval.)]